MVKAICAGGIHNTTERSRHMLNSTLIEVALGLVLVYSLMAILVTQINTIITTLLNMRAKHLKEGLTDLITDTKVRAKVLAHPIVNMVQAKVPIDVDLTLEQARKINSLAETTVAYIAPSTFSEAVMSILISESDKSLFAPYQEAIDDLPNSIEKSQLRENLRRMRNNYSEITLRDAYSLINQIPDEGYRENLLHGLQTVEDALEPLQFKNSELIPVLDGISKIKDKRFQSALSSVLVSAKTLDEAYIKIENWYNDYMSRVTDMFVRRIQMFSIVFAVILSFVLNVDTVFIAQSLLDDDQLRQDVAQTARDFEQTQVERFLEEQANTPSVRVVPVVPGTEGEDSVLPEVPDNEQELADQVQEANDTVQNLFELQLPIGWEFVEVTPQLVNNSVQLGFADPRSNTNNLWNYWPGNNSQWWRLLVQKLVGLIATSIAAAQGAPFWFDLLRKIAQRNPNA